MQVCSITRSVSQSRLAQNNNNRMFLHLKSVAHFILAISARRLVPFPSRCASAKPSYAKGTKLKAFLGVDAETLTYESYIIGKGIILFTMFYCSLNWALYRRTREEFENKENKRNDKDDDKKI